MIPRKSDWRKSDENQWFGWSRCRYQNLTKISNAKRSSEAVALWPKSPLWHASLLWHRNVSNKSTNFVAKKWQKIRRISERTFKFYLSRHRLQEDISKPSNQSPKVGATKKIRHAWRSLCNYPGGGLVWIFNENFRWNGGRNLPSTCIGHEIRHFIFPWNLRWKRKNFCQIELFD